MFLDEARLAAKLNHPSIVHLYDVADEGGMKYIAMEYIPRDGDRHRQARAPVSATSPRARGPRRAADGGRPGLRARGARIGRARVAYRPPRRLATNILLRCEGQTKIVDFGIARAQDELREESGSAGKASYMSPEQVRGEGRLSLGHLLAGHHPLRAPLCQRLSVGRPSDDAHRRREGGAAHGVKRDFPPALELIVMRALEKRPEDRYNIARLYQTFSELLHFDGHQ